jgi:hypothetical protein
MSRFICHNCGETWNRHPATVVPCPDCKAAAGAVCKRPSGHNLFGDDVHLCREQLAVDRGLLLKCSQAVAQVPACPAPAALVVPAARAVATQGTLF